MRGDADPGPARAFYESFRHIDQVAEAIRVADAEFTLSSRAALGGWTCSAELGRAVFQAGALLAPHLGHATVDPRRVLVYVLVDGALRVRGRPLEAAQVGVYRAGAEHQHFTDRFVFAVAAFPEELLARAVLALTGAEWTAPKEAVRFVRPDREAMRGLRRKLAELTTIVRRHPERLESAPMRRSLERETLDAVARALASATPAARMGRPSSHADVVSSVEAFLRREGVEAVTVTEMCEAAGTSERTLRNAFERVYGVGPNRFVRLRRLNEVHRLLQAPSRSGETVAAVATRLGMRDLGRFAGQYRALFGESPSQTLARGRGPTH